MSEENLPAPGDATHHLVGDRLRDWREAERDAESEAPGTAARRMARLRADRARDAFHEAEDREHERTGDPRARQKAVEPEDELRESG